MHPESDLLSELHALAADELPAAEALALRTRIAHEPAVAAAYGRIQAQEERLRALEPLPVPLGLFARIQRHIEQHAPLPVLPQLGFRWAAVRVAAAVLMFFGTWWVLHQSSPDIDSLARPLPLVAEVAAVDPLGAPEATTGEGASNTSWLERFTPRAAIQHDPDLPPALFLIAGGLLVLLGGAVFLRIHRDGPEVA